DDLRRFLDDRPIRARRPTLLQRARKWARRHRPLVGAAAVVVLLAGAMLAGGIGWEAHDWSSKRQATETVVKEALEDADRWQEQRRLPEALSAARRAEGLVRGGTADEALRRRVRRRRADLEFVAELEEVRLRRSDVKDGDFATALGDQLYGEAFRG